MHCTVCMLKFNHNKSRVGLEPKPRGRFKEDVKLSIKNSTVHAILNGLYAIAGGTKRV